MSFRDSEWVCFSAWLQRVVPAAQQGPIVPLHSCWEASKPGPVWGTTSKLKCLVLFAAGHVIKRSPSVGFIPIVFSHWALGLVLNILLLYEAHGDMGKFSQM